MCALAMLRHLFSAVEESVRRPSAPQICVVVALAASFFALFRLPSVGEAIALLLLAVVSMVGDTLLALSASAVAELQGLGVYLTDLRESVDAGIRDIHDFRKQAVPELSAIQKCVNYSAWNVEAIERKMNLLGYSPNDFRSQVRATLSSWGFDENPHWGVRELQKELQVLRMDWLQKQFGPLLDSEVRMLFRTISDEVEADRDPTELRNLQKLYELDQEGGVEFFGTRLFRPGETVSMLSSQLPENRAYLYKVLRP